MMRLVLALAATILLAAAQDPAGDKKCEGLLEKECGPVQKVEDECHACVKNITKARERYDHCTKRDVYGFCGGKPGPHPAPVEDECARDLKAKCGEQRAERAECEECLEKMEPTDHCTLKEEFAFCDHDVRPIQESCEEFLNMDCGSVKANERECLACIQRVAPKGRLYNCSAREEKTYCAAPKPTPSEPGAEYCCGTTGEEKCDGGDLTELVVKFNPNMTMVSIRAMIDGDSSHCRDEAVVIGKGGAPGAAHPVTFSDINSTTDCLNKLLVAQGATPSDLAVTYADDSRFRTLHVAIADGPTLALKQCNLPKPPPPPPVQTLPGGLIVETTAAATACDRKTATGDSLSMHYTGTLATTGAKFDSSRDRNQPFEFELGAGRVIKGWDQGLTGMCVGEKRELTIAAELGYGDRGAGGDIPGGATLHFEVECLDIKEGAAPQNIFADMDIDPQDNNLSVEEITAWFKTQGRDLPDGLMENEDKDGDGRISWQEFGGPKGSEPELHTEL